MFPCLFQFLEANTKLFHFLQKWFFNISPVVTYRSWHEHRALSPFPRDSGASPSGLRTLHLPGPPGRDLLDDAAAGHPQPTLRALSEGRHSPWTQLSVTGEEQWGDPLTLSTPKSGESLWRLEPGAAEGRMQTEGAAFPRGLVQRLGMLWEAELSSALNWGIKAWAECSE